jgi:hypothetical protein
MLRRARTILMVAAALFVGALLMGPTSGYSSGSVDECQESCD